MRQSPPRRQRGIRQRLPLFLLGFVFLSACSTSHHWFEAKSWFEEKGPEANAPSYIPLSAVPEKPTIKKLK